MRVGDWQEFPGCTLADAMPEGEQAIFQPGDGGTQRPKFLTHAGDLVPPRDGTDWPIYHFITNVGGFQIVGKSQHFDPITWWWSGIQRGWEERGPTNGVNGAIFDGAGQIRQILPGPNATSQGYRFVAPNGEPVLGDLTRQPKFDIIEWVDLSDDQDGGLLVGQRTDGSDNCVIRIAGVTRLVQAGRCTFIRGRRSGALVALAMFTTWLSGEHPVGGVFVCRATLDQLATLPEIQPRVVTVPAVDREMWVGWYEFARPDQPAPGNCFVACDLIGVTAPPGSLPLPTIVATRHAVSGPILGQYIVGATVDEIEAAARVSAHRVIAYWDQTREWPRLPNLPPGAWTCVRGYCLKDETPELLERSLRGVISRMPGHRLALVCQGYTSNPKLASDVAGLVPVYARLAKIPQVEALLIFSDAGRDGGLNHNPDLRPLWQQVADSIRTPSMTVPTPPRFTISEPTFPLTAEIDPGGEFRFRCVVVYTVGSGEPDWIEWQYSESSKDGPWQRAALNEGWDRDHMFRIVRAGTFWIRARAWNAAGTHVTGLERKVTVTVKTQPPDPPDPHPPDSQTRVIKTDDGHFLSVRADGLVEAKATAVDAPDIAHMAVVEVGQALTVTINGKYVNAVNGGGGELYANRDQPGPDEMHDLTFPRTGVFTWQTRDGHFVHAENGGGGRVLATKTVAGPHETFQTVGGSGAGPLLPLRMESGRFRTDAGWIVPRGYSVFHALALVRDGNLDELRRLFDRAQQARCNMVRVFGQWHYIGSGMTPYTAADPNWFTWMQIVLQEAAARGLYVALSYFCDAQVLQPEAGHRIQLFEELARWAQDKPGLLVMAANEARKNGWSEADDPALLDLVRRFRAINATTLLGASDPLDVNGSSVEDYNRRQQTIAATGVDFLLVHSNRKDRYAWVDHLKGAAETPEAVHFPGICWHEEPMGGASHDVAGKRDGSPIAHIAAACVGAMTGGYTYMHRQLEDDVAPGLIESGIASEIPGSPDWHFINATLGESPVEAFTDFDKCRTTSNGSQGWVVAYGTREGTITYREGWRETARNRWSDGTGVCVLTQVARG